MTADGVVSGEKNGDKFANDPGESEGTDSDGEGSGISLGESNEACRFVKDGCRREVVPKSTGNELAMIDLFVVDIVDMTMKRGVRERDRENTKRCVMT